MRSDIAISVNDLTKTYRIFNRPGDRIKQVLALGRVRFHEEFTALQNVSFEIKKGESVGILGRNGSGKSTLLQVICGILKPTSGNVNVNGRISALLELGAGFNPEFTGRENVYFQGALMGYTKSQMDERFCEIADFADIGDFIDQPVRIYSSGMFVRLAFAVAINVAPDILIIDEALGVGDKAFRFKCLKQIDILKQSGCSIILVSHNLLDIRRICTRGIVLQSGEIRTDDTIDIAINKYESLLTDESNSYHETNPRIIDVECLDTDGSVTTKFIAGEDICFRISLDTDLAWGESFTLVCNLTSPTHGCLSSFSSKFQNKGRLQHITLQLRSPPILMGTYVVNTTLLSSTQAHLENRRDKDTFMVASDAADAEHWSTISTGFISMKSQWQEGG